MAGNAAVAAPLMITAHGLDVSERMPFIWYRTPSAREWFPPGRRTITAALVLDLMHAVGNHPQSDLLHRAIEAFRQALGHWTPEEQLMAGEFLFIAAETLSRCIVEQRAADQSMTPKNLARLEGAGNERVLRRRILSADIFGGDEAALDAMEQASNGFEHGYMGIAEVRGLMESVLARSMGHVRKALITTASPTPNTTRELLSDEYAEPLGLVPVLQVLQGHLRRTDPDLSPPVMDSPAVELDWPPGPIEAARTPDGNLQVKMPATITVALLPPNTTVDIEGVGIRAAAVTSLATPDVSVSKPVAKDPPARGNG
ncbi:MAG: hypothetical protein ACR2OG_03410 [Gemmatimonadaceae bacterium]